MKLLQTLKKLRGVIASGALVALAVALPIAVTAADTIKMEAKTGVANVTAGDTTYGSSVNASYNQVIKVMVTYNNTEDPGSDKVAKNVRVKLNVPTTAGKSQSITSRMSADNVSAISGNVTVNLDRADAYLQYIPGSAEWKHADAQTGAITEQKVSDDIVLGNDGLVLEHEDPCKASSVAILVGVVVPGVSVDKTVRVKGTSTWATSITAEPGATVQYKIAYKNTGNSTENNVVVADRLPVGVSYVAGSSMLANQSSPSGASLADGVASGGIVIGNYAPGANAFLMFEAKLPAADKLSCGENKLRNVATVQPEGMNYYYNTADVTVTKDCAPAQTYSCDGLTVTTGADRTVTVKDFKTTASGGATFKNVVIDWGDQSTPLTTDAAVNKMHQYTADGSYTITATAHFMADGKEVTTSGNCVQTVNFTAPTTPTTPTTPTELPNTGAGNVIGIFAAAVAAGTIGFRLFIGRKLARS